MIDIPLRPYYNKVYDYAFKTRSYNHQHLYDWIQDEYPSATIDNGWVYATEMIITFDNEQDATAFVLRFS